MQTLTYLAQPYTGYHEAAYEFALAMIAREALYDSNTTLFSPIIHYHAAADHHGLPGKFRFWLPHNLAFLSVCSELRVVCSTGWYESIGVAVEMEFARRNSIPIRYYAANSVYSSTPSGTRYCHIAAFHAPQKEFPYAYMTEQLQIEAEDKREREASL